MLKAGPSPGILMRPRGVRSGQRVLGECAVAATIALACGVLAAEQSRYLVLGLMLGCAMAVLLSASISFRAGAVALIGLGQLASGHFYVAGQLPKSFSLGMDVLVLGLLAIALPKILARGETSSMLALAFVALAGLQVLNPLVPSFSYGFTGFRQVALPAATLLAVSQIELTARERKLVVAVLLTGWSFSMGFALRQWLGQFSAAEIAWAQASNSTYLVDDQMRLMGAAQSNQDFALAAAVALPAVAVLAYTARTRAVRLVGGLAFLLSLAVLVGCLVRSGLVGGVVGASVAVAIATISSRDARRLLVLGVALAAVLWAATQLLPASLLGADKVATLQSRVSSILSPSQDYAVRQRQATSWPKALHIVATHPWGGGAGSAGPLSQKYEMQAPFGAVVPDNGYLLIAVQMGVVGVGLFVALLLRLLRDLIRGSRAGSGFAAAGAGALVATMFAMLAGNYWSLPAPATVLGLLVGMGLQEANKLRAA